MKLPTLQDFAFSENDRKTLENYFQSFPQRVISGLALVISTNHSLRTRLLYALNNEWTIKGTPRDLDGGGVSTLESKTSFSLPAAISTQQLEYHPGQQLAQLKTLMRSAPDFILIDKIQDIDVSKYIYNCFLTGARVIAGIDAKTTEEGLQILAATPTDLLDNKEYGLDLIVFAEDEKNMQVFTGKPSSGI